MITHILLIDDDEDELDIFMEAIGELHAPFNCIFAKGAEQAIGMLTGLVPDFIFLDFNMPKMNGLKCLTEIRKMQEMQKVPVILYSNFINEETTKKAMALGAFSCIKKPSTVSKLAKILHELIMSNGGRQSGQMGKA